MASYYKQHSNILLSLCKQTSDQSDDKISLAHARYIFKPGDKITK